MIICLNTILIAINILIDILIDIIISKGDLEYALKKVNSLKEIQTNDKVVELLNVSALASYVAFELSDVSTPVLS